MYLNFYEFISGEGYIQGYNRQTARYSEGYRGPNSSPALFGNANLSPELDRLRSSAPPYPPKLAALLGLQFSTVSPTFFAARVKQKKRPGDANQPGPNDRVSCVEPEATRS